MSGSFSDYLENKILDHLRGTSYTAPGGLYVALYSVAPTDAGGGTEVTTTIRTAGRVAATFGAASGGSISNSALVDFGASAGSATIVAFAVFDAASAGNMLFYGPVTTSLAITAGINVSFAIGALTLTLD
jgi:hypothetical protein